MALLNLRNLFAKKQPEALPPSEIAWSESSMYNSRDFAKYNPDALLSRKGFGIYGQMMIDEQIKAVVRFKRDAITSRDWVFNMPDCDLSADEIELRKQVFTKAITGMQNPFSDSLNGIMSAMYNGYSITEKVLHQELVHEGKLYAGIKKLKLKPCDTFYFHTDEYGNIVKVTQQFDSKEQEVDASRIIHYVQNPDYDEHYGRSELRECYRAWFSKNMIIKFQNIHLERFAAGFIWAQPEAGKTLVSGTQEYTSLQAVMSNLQSTSSIILPSGIALNVEHPATTDAFERAISQHDKSIAKALLVPNLMGISEQGSTGSYSQSQTQLEAFLWTLDADATRLEAVLNQQLFTELGDLNFGDGIYPVFKFKPISDVRKLEIVKIWKDLVVAGAVQATDIDEAYIRDALELPKKTIIEGDAPDLILNGAQVSALTGIVAQVGAGTLSPEAAKAVITAVFPITEDQAAAMVDNSKVEAPEPTAVLPVAGDPELEPEDAPDDEPELETMEETVVGKMGISISAFSKAMKRCDFAVIANKADNNVEDTTIDVARINSEAVARLMTVIEDNKLGTAEGNPNDIPKVQYTASEMAALKNAINKGLQAAWSIGESHGRREINKANKSFATNDLALQDMAVAYLKQKSYTLAGDISAATKKTINNILMEGIKVSKTTAETKTAIYKALESDGLVSEEAVVEALGASTVKNASARIETAIKTTSFEAINEARYSLFSDPAMDGFVEALEYSSILDDRTTDICSQLDGQIYAIDAEEWSTFRPPNHFNAVLGGTAIHTATGMVSIEDVRVGDEVMTHEGRFKPVYAVMSKPNDTELARELKLSTGGCLRVTDEHPILTLSGWKRADEVLIGDKVFQRREQISSVPFPGSTKVTQAILLDAHNRKPLVNEESIAYQIGSFTPGMSSAVQLKIDVAVENEIQNVGANRNLHFKFNDSKQFSKSSFVFSQIFGIDISSAIRRLDLIFNKAHWIVAHHVFGMLFSKLIRCFLVLCAPVIRAGSTLAGSHVQAGSITLATHNNSMSFANIEQSGFAISQFALNGTNGFSSAPMLFNDNTANLNNVEHDASGNWLEATIISNDVYKYNGRVYNLAVQDDETYMADNVLVHNCRSILIPVIAGDGWQASDAPTVDPQKGFGFSKCNHKGQP